MCLCTPYCTHSLSSVNMKSLQIDFNPSHSVCWLKIQIKSDNPTALRFRGCILQSSSLTQFIMGSLHCHPQLITWQRLVMHASLFFIQYVLLCHLFKPSKTDTDSFTMQIHYNCMPLSLLPRDNFCIRMWRQRTMTKHQFLTSWK